MGNGEGKPDPGAQDGKKRRFDLIRKIEEVRKSKVICYLTTLRQNVLGQMAEDAVRVIFDHLLLLPERPVEKIDIYLCSNGGSGTVPWRLTALLREFSKSFAVLIPYRAYSAASMLALGADEIVMHPFGEMGPIDPTVSNDFNPIEGGQRVGISVEDVKAYVSFIKNTVGITHEDELVKTIEILANKVHPLALGNVERFIAQSRMIARKILLTHMKEVDGHTIDEIIENMASRLYFHGHPINRREAKDELRLKVVAQPQSELETAMWELYRECETEFKNQERFRPADEVLLDYFSVPNLQPGFTVTKDFALLHATVESARLSSKFVSNRRVFATHSGTPNPVLRDVVIDEGWKTEPIA